MYTVYLSLINSRNQARYFVKVEKLRTRKPVKLWTDSSDRVLVMVDGT